MQLTIRPARRSEAKPLIGIYAESGCGKTLSALLLARGFIGPKGRIAMIETESGRGEVYADAIPGGYLVIPIRGEFSPRIYGDAISLAEQEGVDALIIDSASHEWEGVGGVLDMAAQNEAAGKRGQVVWQQPKIDHQRYFMLRLMQTPISIVIVCMRAKYPMEQIENPKTGKKDWVRSEKLTPKQSEDVLFEMLVHGWVDHEHRFNVTKYTRDEELKHIIIDKQPLSIATGEALARWAAGDSGPAPTLDEVMAKIRDAKSEADLAAVAMRARRLAGDDAAKARAAFKQRTNDLRAKPAPKSSAPPPEDPGYGPPPMSESEAREAEEALNP